MRNVVQFVREALINNFRELDKWFQKEEALLDYKPSMDQWNIREVLEHISLTNYFLLLTINKSTRRALERKMDGLIIMAPHDYEEKFRQIEIVRSKSFGWVNPAHLEPSGSRDLYEVRMLLKQQFAQCMYNLSLLKNGEGRLVKTMMTVNNLGKLDIYQYIFFLTKHIERHQAQMQELREQYEDSAVAV
ncbi:DinB family protein [Chitinophaga alhagiae]|uniref:DinB family protein n=1 Tax=Chitinophaga alhagiae TaxID=2203219 RepID=A0ABN5LWL8_9BACT|nr:DinB family protein [Chitinophaga alhagiae]AWO01196.1 DinB family protein [Chitinophaga alhagiae]